MAPIGPAFPITTIKKTIMKIIKGIFNRRDDNRIQIKKDESGEWTVIKGLSILYIGTKEKCEIFMKYLQEV